MPTTHAARRTASTENTSTPGLRLRRSSDVAFVGPMAVQARTLEPPNAIPKPSPFRRDCSPVPTKFQRRNISVSLRLLNTHLFMPRPGLRTKRLFVSCRGLWRDFSLINEPLSPFRFKRAAFYMGLKSKVGLVAAKASALRINLNIQGCSIVAPPLHAPSRAPLLLPLLLSHKIPLPRVH